MPETIRILEDLGIIHIISFGKLTKEDLLESRQSVSRICQEQGFTKILVDATAVTSMPPKLFTFEHSVDLTRLNLPKNTRFAIVTSETIEKDSRFIETVSINRGIIMRNLNSKDEALAWLKE